MQRGKSESESEYLMRRLAQEEAATASAADSRARESHRQMAERFRQEWSKKGGGAGGPQTPEWSG